MAVTAGAITVLSVQSTSATLQSAPATAGTGPYTYQWHRGLTSGFTPGGGTIISGATGLTLNDSGLIPNTTYFYKVVATDTGAGNATSTSAPATVVTAVPSQVMNTFNQSPLLGQTDLRLNFNTVSVQIDSTQSGKLYPGAPVKIVDSAGGVPKVVGITADTDEVYGYINYDAKSQWFEAGSLAEISMGGNCIYLYATTAIARGAQVQSSFNPGGVAAAVGSSGKAIVGWAYDKAVTPGTLIRVMLTVPSFRVA